MSASVTQLLSSWTSAAADGPGDLPTARVLTAVLGRASERFTAAAATCDLPFRRAGVAIATDILPQVFRSGGPKRRRGLDSRSQGRGGATRSASENARRVSAWPPDAG